MNKNKKNQTKKKKIACIILSMIIGFFIIMNIVYIDNKNIDYDNINIDFNKQNDSIEIKVIQLSDLHFPKIEINIDKMITHIKDEKPDIIAITGDLIDKSAKIDTCGVCNFIDKIKNVAPIYYVNGNHEEANNESDKLYDYLRDNGIFVLKNQSLNFTIKTKRITIIGINDNENFSSNDYIGNEEIENNYRILLAHHPEKWLTYSSNMNVIPPNLVLSGHAHGGQIRFFGKGLYAPNQGFFPEFDSGLYTYPNGKVNMIVSRGIGNSILPYRFNNKPHVPIISIFL